MKGLLIILLTTLIMTTNSLMGQSDKLITDLSIKHIVKYPATYKTDSDEKYPVIITFHGHGSNEKDLIGLSEYLQDDLFWISGRGPSALGGNSFDWYELPPTPEKIAAILQKINTFINELKSEYPIDTNKIFLMGFSQGSMISLSYALAFPSSVAGIIAQSGAIPPNIGLKIDTQNLIKMSIIITHGIEDRMMPIARAREAKDFLNKLKVDLSYNEFHMGHTINAESIVSVRNWLGLKLSKK